MWSVRDLTLARHLRLSNTGAGVKITRNLQRKNQKNTGYKMMKTKNKGGPFGFLAYFTSDAAQAAKDRGSMGHAEAFNQLQCPNIHRAPDHKTPLFGSSERQLGAPESLFPKEAAFARQSRSRLSGDSPIHTWRRLLKSLTTFGPKGQMAGINSYINSQVDVSRIAASGKSKSWATPMRVFKCGDKSEEYAMAKYVSFRLLGFHSDRLRMVWLAEDGSEAHHAVLAVNLKGNVFILDNRTDTIATDHMLTAGHPFCSLNGGRFSLHWDQSNPDGPNGALKKMAHYTDQLAAA